MLFKLINKSEKEDLLSRHTKRSLSNMSLSLSLFPKIILSLYNLIFCFFFFFLNNCYFCEVICLVKHLSSNSEIFDGIVKLEIEEHVKAYFSITWRFVSGGNSTFWSFLHEENAQLQICVMLDGKEVLSIDEPEKESF